VPERLFLFLQLEFPWELGPPDGRYLLRSREEDSIPGGRAGGESEAGEAGGPQHVVVLNTLGAPRRGGAGAGPGGGAGANAGRGALTLPGLGARRMRRPRATTPDPSPVPTSRATIVDPISVSAERQAQAWLRGLRGLDAERETRAATAVLNRVLYAHRIATADPHTHEVAPAQALVIRAGWGAGEQLADGYWQHALELPWAPTKRAQRRAAALRPEERLAELLGARGEELLCEELALRARLDLDQGRLAHAAHELDAALGAALGELGAEANPALTPRVDELRALRAGVSAMARAALSSAIEATDAPEATGAGDPTSSENPTALDEEPDEDAVRHALERLEAALRARTAGGFTGG